MGEKEEFVELTVKVKGRKQFIEPLKEVNYFGMTEDEFWKRAFYEIIESRMNEMPLNNMRSFEHKHGLDILSEESGWYA